MQHAANEQRYRSIIVSSEDTDVRILCLSFSFSIDVPIDQRCVSQLNARYVDIGKIAHVIGEDGMPGTTKFACIYGLRCSECLCRDWESEVPEEVTE